MTAATMRDEIDTSAMPKRGVWAFVRRHPTVVIGGLLLLAIVVGALAAPWLGTIDPISIDPVQRLKDHPPQIGVALVKRTFRTARAFALASACHV